MRKCSRCKTVKELEEFPINKANRLNRDYLCKPCKKLKNTEDRHKRDYGLTSDQLNQLLKNQNNCCKICTRKFTSRNRHIDHCHETGKVRGILCSRCNTGLGHFGDSIDDLQKAINYLKTA